DVVTGVAGTPVASMDDLLEALERRQPGEVVAVTILRDGKPAEVKVRLGQTD
ncbi:MAG: PDZ domain-containing protein, partial [Pseudomonadota bacterium]